MGWPSSRGSFLKSLQSLHRMQGAVGLDLSPLRPRILSRVVLNTGQVSYAHSPPPLDPRYGSHHYGRGVVIPGLWIQPSLLCCLALKQPPLCSPRGRACPQIRLVLLRVPRLRANWEALQRHPCSVPTRRAVFSSRGLPTSYFLRPVSPSYEGCCVCLFRKFPHYCFGGRGNSITSGER